MELEQLLEYLNQRLPVKEQTEEYTTMVRYSSEAMRITARLNNAWHSHEAIRQLMSELTGTTIDSSFRMFPPFHSDFGKNITIGKGVFINSGCCFQDQGGISIGDGTLIGHKVVLATLNHGFSVHERHWNYPAPIRIGKNVWIGANATILQGVTIGDNAIVAAGAVVSHDVAPNTIVAGVPARFVKTVDDAEKQQRLKEKNNA